MTKGKGKSPRYEMGDAVEVKGHPALADTDATVKIDDGDMVMVAVYGWRKLKGYAHRNTWVQREFVVGKGAAEC